MRSPFLRTTWSSKSLPRVRGLALVLAALLGPARSVAGAGPADGGAAAGEPSRDAAGDLVPAQWTGSDQPAEWPGPGEPPRFLPRAEFLERSYVFYDVPNIGPAGNQPLVFEAWLAPHLFIVNQLSRVENPREHARWLFTFGATFQLRLRMVGDQSTPVRPPSYMPRLDLQAFRFWKVSTEEHSERLWMLELRLTPWGHHSNGQQYCAFAEGVLDGDGCPPVDRRNVRRDRLNYRAGSFSTNYAIAGVHLAHLRLDDDTRAETARIAGGVLFEVNPPGFGPGSAGRVERKLYGPYRLRVEGELSRHVTPRWRKLAGVGSLSGSFEVMWNTGDDVPWNRAMLEVSHVFDGAGGLGVFARYVSGQDYLNILFAEKRVETLQLGLVWDLSPRLRYRFTPR